MDELIKVLRETDFSDGCPCEAEPMCASADCIIAQAADAIEQLSKDLERSKEWETFWEKEANEALKKFQTTVASIPRWIPVTERLPKEGEFVLVYGDLYPNKHDGGVIAVSKRMDWNYWQGFGRERDITHWMPLPPAPKEET